MELKGFEQRQKQLEKILIAGEDLLGKKLEKERKEAKKLLEQWRKKWRKVRYEM